MHDAYIAIDDSYVFSIQLEFFEIFWLLFRTNALQLLLELLGTYTKESALKARSDAVKYVIPECFSYV